MRNYKPSRLKTGFSLIEVSVSIVIIMVLASGVMSYQYHAVRQSQRANAENNATRIGTLLIENWKVHGGDENFNPEELDLGITKVRNEDLYLIRSNNIPLYFDLSYEDIQADATTGITLRELTLLVQWKSNYALIVPGSDDPMLEITSYVRLDQSGG